MKPYVDVLGTKYRIEVRKWDDDPFLKEKQLDGYCSEYEKLIVLADHKTADYATLNDIEKENLVKATLRHELIHAFLNESGLSSSANVWNMSWAKNEEMVDWMAVQFPKILEAYKWCECL